MCSPSSYHIDFLFYSLLIFLASTTISSSYSGNETDHEALLKIKSMISLDPYGALSSWNSSLNFCDWGGVLCGRRHRRVTYLVLESQGLEGSLSPHAGNLSFLRLLSLWNNSLQGRIPHELGRLSRLRVLVLQQNIFNGVIPAALSNCSNLQGLYLSYNKLVGSIPSEISILSKLTVLSVTYNNLTGGIPHFLGNITSIESFSAVGNPLGGSIPHALGHCKNLREFFCGICNLSGAIPHSFFNLSLLTNISLAENQLTDSLSSAIGATFPHLLELQLSDNKLTGPLPSWISNCSKLIYLEMNSNNFNGRLMIDFSKLRYIYQIYLGKNLLGSKEEDEMKFIDSLKNCSRLDTLSLRNCKFQGLLPTSIGNLSDQLRYLSLAENQLHGTLPSSIGNLLGLVGLYLGGNRLTGNIPSTIVKVLRLENQGAQRSFIRECEALRSIRHRNLLKIITSCSSIDFQGNDSKALVYEYMSNGSLHHWLHSSVNASTLSLLQRINILIDVASALDYIHNHSVPTIVHGDVKPSNILLDDDMVAHVGDFGLARFLGTTSYQNSSTRIRGTIGYVAPEYGLGSDITSSGDVYSFGITVLEIMTGKKPTDDIFNDELSLHKFAYMALPDHVADVIDINILNFYQDDKITMQNKVANKRKIEECLASLVEIGVSCSVDLPSQRMGIEKVVHQLHDIMNMIQNI